MNVLNVAQTVFFLSLGLVLFGVPYCGLISLIAALVTGVVMLINLIKAA